jgi:hypothetical protein
MYQSCSAHKSVIDPSERQLHKKRKKVEGVHLLNCGRIGGGDRRVGRVKGVRLHRRSLPLPGADLMNQKRTEFTDKTYTPKKSL